jgi:hypothetical protein
MDTSIKSLFCLVSGYRTKLQQGGNQSDRISLSEAGYPPFTNDEVFREILEQAENFKKNRVEIRPYSVDAAIDSRMVAKR